MMFFNIKVAFSTLTHAMIYQYFDYVIAVIILNSCFSKIRNMTHTHTQRERGRNGIFAAFVFALLSCLEGLPGSQAFVRQNVAISSACPQEQSSSFWIAGYEGR